MIPYIELVKIDSVTTTPYAIVEPVEFWAELSYNDVGECELYCSASQSNLYAVKKGLFIRIPNERYLWLITSITYTYNVSGGRMILAKGYEAKYLLSKRIILHPLELQQQDLGAAIYKLVEGNLGFNAAIGRRLPRFTTISNTLGVTIESMQVVRSNLLDFTNNLLKTYSCGAYILISNNYLYYQMIKGRDLHESIIFSQSNDNLLSTEYYDSDEDFKTFAQVVSKVNDIEYEKEYELELDLGGYGRNELLVNSDLSTTYTDADGNEQTTAPDSALYQSWQVDEAKKALADHTTNVEVKGVIDLVNSKYVFDEDYFLGDIVLIKDEYFNFESRQRINKITFKQNADGYGLEIEYGGL